MDTLEKLQKLNEERMERFARKKRLKKWRKRKKALRERAVIDRFYDSGGAHHGRWEVWYEKLIADLSTPAKRRIENSLSETIHRILIFERSMFEFRKRVLSLRDTKYNPDGMPRSLLAELYVQPGSGLKYQLKKELKDLRMRRDILALRAMKENDFSAVEAQVKAEKKRMEASRRYVENKKLKAQADVPFAEIGGIQLMAKKKSKNVICAFQDELLNQLDSKARQLYCTRSWLIREAVKFYLQADAARSAIEQEYSMEIKKTGQLTNIMLPEEEISELRGLRLRDLRYEPRIRSGQLNNVPDDD